MKAPEIYILPPVLRYQNVLRQTLSSSGVAYLMLDSCDMDLRAWALMTLLHRSGFLWCLQGAFWERGEVQVLVRRQGSAALLAQDSTHLVSPIEQYVTGPVDRPSIH